MSKENIKEEYQELAKKYKLPKYSELDLDFEVSTIDKKKFLLREIRRRMLDKFDGIKNILELIIQPDTASFSSMYETRIFNDEEEKKKIYDLYRALMIIERTANIVNLRADEKEEADFVNNTFAEWKKIKPELLFFFKKIKKSWEKETSVKEDLGYLG